MKGPSLFWRGFPMSGVLDWNPSIRTEKHRLVGIGAGRSVSSHGRQRRLPLGSGSFPCVDHRGYTFPTKQCQNRHRTFRYTFRLV
eukprot:16774_5